MSDPVNIINPVKTQSICISVQSLNKPKLEELEDLEESVDDLHRMCRGRERVKMGRTLEVNKSCKYVRRRYGRGDEESSRKDSVLNCDRSRTFVRKSQSPRSKRGRSKSTSLSPVKKQKRLRGPRRKYTRRNLRKSVFDGKRNSKRVISTSPASQSPKASESVNLLTQKKSSIKRKSPSKSDEHIICQCLSPKYSEPKLEVLSNRASIEKQVFEDCYNCCGNLMSTTDVTQPLKIKSQTRSQSFARTMSTSKRTVSRSPSESIPDYRHPILNINSRLMKKEQQFLRMTRSTPKSLRIKPERSEPFKPFPRKQQRQKQSNKTATLIYKIATKNPFFNFLRQFRKNRGDWHPCKVAVEGSRKWCSLGEKERIRFAGPFLARANIGGYVRRHRRIMSVRKPSRKISVKHEHKRIKKWLNKRGAYQRFRRSKRRPS